MVTFLIIFSAVLVVLSVVQFALTIRACRARKSYLKMKATYENAATRTEEFSGRTVRITKTVVVNDMNGDAPDVPEKRVIKKLKSAVGYATVSKLKDYIWVERVDGTARYSIDLFVTPVKKK